MSEIPLRGAQRKYLRGLAHGLKPLIQVGRAGLAPGLVANVDEALQHHELIKVRFLEHKAEKRELSAALADQLDAALAGIIGHVAIFYRPASEPADRRIDLPG